MKHADLIGKMTLEEKCALLQGATTFGSWGSERLGIPTMEFSDGPNGLRHQLGAADHLGIAGSEPATCFPTAVTVANTWDEALGEKIGEALGEEAAAQGVGTLLGPGLCMKRSPLCGRNFEYFSEDPYLAGKMAAAYISGVQSKHVGTSIKHFALNDQETNRMNISAEASERTIREIYFPAFEIAVKESQPKTVMCSYNKINGTYSSDNEWLLNKVLREDWGFKGAVMTDWGAVDDRVQGVKAGLELEMPGNTAENDKKIVEAVRSGALDERLVDRAVERLLTVMYDHYDNRVGGTFDRDRDHEVAEKVEENCAVLLQNNGILPLKVGQKIVYIGEYAEKPRYQGGGSSHINSSKVVSALDAAKAAGRTISYVKGFPGDRNEENADLLAEAVAAAKEADVAVIFAGLPDVIESEGYDRRDMKMPACQIKVIEEVAKVQKNVVVVLHNGSPIEVPWAEDVAAILEMYLGGQAVGTAEDHLLFGIANPSGHLAETFPVKLEDNPSYLNFPGDSYKVHYQEGVFVGYRYYDTKKMPVRWAFGHGLSYTTFAIGNLRVDRAEMGDDDVITASVDVTNTGDREGKEVVQLYVADRTGTTGRPVKELKGFAKVDLAPGETKTVTFPVDRRALCYFEERLGDWYAASGTYALLVGDASNNIAAEKEISFATKVEIPMHVTGGTTIGQLLSNPKTAAIVQQMMAKASPFGGESSTKKDEPDAGMGAGEDEMNKAMMMYMPLKALIAFGVLTPDSLAQLVATLNGALEQN